VAEKEFALQSLRLVVVTDYTGKIRVDKSAAIDSPGVKVGILAGVFNWYDRLYYEGQWYRDCCGDWGPDWLSSNHTMYQFLRREIETRLGGSCPIS